jgi:hypothetical protein
MSLVVVADDDADVRDLGTVKLEQLGVEVVTPGTRLPRWPRCGSGVRPWRARA